jgi:hypothetical protein
MDNRSVELRFKRKKLCIIIGMVEVFSVLLTIAVPVLLAMSDGPERALANNYEYVNLSYLASHQTEFEGKLITVTGTVRHYASVTMFENFFLENQSDQRTFASNQSILVVTRNAGLPEPNEGSIVEVSGKWEFYEIEGGHYYLNASILRKA